jgi:A/G-specific adenine glycosylase
MSRTVTAHQLTVEAEARPPMRSALLAWFRRHRRDLPWRGVDDPYAVWVSEVMLQQTQVATVIDYYHRWLERFPSVEDLAGAELEAVLEMWAGLGYYRRARFLHESAKMVVDQMGGALPETAEGLEALKGVGPYTAGAIASIAFGKPAPVVDGNVERVLSRLFGIAGDPKSTPNQKLYWKLAGELVDPDAPGDFNEGMMELGATVCTPQNPTCMLCPLRTYCCGFEQGEPTAYPATTKRTRQRPVTVQTALIVRPAMSQAAHTDEEFLVIKRPPDGLLGGLWEFPSVQVDADTASTGIDGYLGDRLGLVGIEKGEPDDLGEFVHHFSHIRMTIEVQLRRLACDGGGIEPALDFDQPLQWVPLDELDSLAMSAAMRKVVALYESQSE